MTDPTFTVVALLVTGYLLLAVEAFVVPGFGVAGIGGFLCLAAGCYLAYHHFGGGYGAIAIVLVLGATTALLRWIPRSPFGRDVVHSTSLAAARASEPRLAPGTVGVTESSLRPSGIARFGDQRQSVVTEGEFIDVGSKVRITEIHGSRVVVELAPPEE